jgi:hypothetical protein
MRHAVCWVLLIFSIPTFGQVALDSTYIIYTRHYQKGIYKTFREFQVNQPSVAKFFFNGKNLWAPDKNGNNVKVKKRDVWGFSDGINVYVRRNKYSPLLLVGRYSYFIEKGTRIMFAYGFTPFALIPIPMPYRDKLVLDFNTGQMALLTKSTLRQILRQEDPELLSQFEAEKHKGKKVEEYLIRYNKRTSHRID